MLFSKQWMKYFTIPLFFILLTHCKEAPNEPRTVRPDLIEVRITSPIDNSIIIDPLVISAEVESENPIVQVNFFIDQKILGASTKLPYSITPDITPWADNEMHTIKCTAVDNLNNVNSAKVTITISDQVKNNIALLEPSQNDTIRNANSVNFSWHHFPAKEFIIQIAKDVQFFEIVQQDSTNQKNFLSDQLEQGSYYWRIGYFLEDISGIFWSGFRRFTIGGPRAPTFVSHQNEQISNFRIENTFIWNRPEFAIQHQIQIKDFYTGGIIYDDILNDTLTTKNLEMYVYKIRARAKNEVGNWGEWSSEIIFSNGLYTKVFTLPNEMSVAGCIELPDSGFVIASSSNSSKYTKLMRVDALCNEEFNSTISNFIIHEFSLTSDNNIIMVGMNSNYNSKIVKVDQSFNLIWEFEPVNNDQIYLTNVTNTQSGEYLLIGLYNEDYVTSENQIYYSALSSSGTLLFERFVGDPRSVGYHIEEFNNGYLIMAVQNDTIVGSDAIYNLLIDTDGSVLSQFKYLEFVGFPGQNYQVRDGFRVGNDIYCVGNFGSRYGSFVHKSDIFGTEHWKVNLTNSVPSSAEKCIATNDGNLLVGGDEENLFLFKLGPDGNIIWSFDNDYDNTYCRGLINTVDDGIILLTSSSLATRTVRFIKLNRNGITYKN